MNSRFFRLLIFILFSATFIIATSAQDEQPMGEYWKRTGLKIQDLSRLVTDKFCRSSDRAFLGCAVLLNTLIPERQQLVPGNSVPSQVRGLSLIDKDSDPTQTEELAPTAQIIRVLKQRRVEFKSRWMKYRWSHEFSFEQAFQTLSLRIAASTDESELTARAYNYFLEIYNDPHTYILPASYAQKATRPDQETFVGVGIQLARLGRYPFVQSTLAGGPAEVAGLQRNDIIVAIDGTPMRDLKLDEAAKKLKGPNGTSVSVTVWRENKKVSLEIKRGELTRVNVQHRLIEKDSRRFTYVKVASFMRENLCSEVTRALVPLEDADGVILDLRDNGGGLVDTAICLTSLFIPNGKSIVKIKNFSDGEIDNLLSRGGALTTLPTVVLINSGSASASEIVAGALQDYRRAWIVGERSWGKGSVQRSEVWAWNDKIWLFKTIARYYLPGGRSIQLSGITPDVSVGNEVSIREEDLQGSILPAENVPLRKRPVGKLQSCLSRRTSVPSSQAKSDRQLDVALDVLACEAGS